MAGLFGDDESLDTMLFVFQVGEFKSVEFNRDYLEELRNSSETYYFKEPVDDGMEYCWLEWQNLDEALLADYFKLVLTPQEMISFKSGKSINFPQTWSVMLG